jgi:hypothetical protein
MDRRWLMLTAVLFAGCTRAPDVQVPLEPPKPVSKDFAKLKSILDGLPRAGEVALYEGLPSEFWEPQLRESEANRKKTIGLHGYLFYDERLAPGGSDLEQLTALFTDARSFVRYRSTKVCGGYHPDYCVEWKNGDVTTRALICLECGEVQFFGRRNELYCDLSPEANRRLARWLSPYQKNRPAAASRG